MSRDSRSSAGVVLPTAPVRGGGPARVEPLPGSAGTQGAVRIEVESATEGADLVRALATRGLSARVCLGPTGTRVELAPSREPLDRLLVDLLPALERWRGDRGRGQLVCLVGRRRLVLDAHAGALTRDRRLRAAARRILEAGGERRTA